MLFRVACMKTEIGIGALSDDGKFDTVMGRKSNELDVLSGKYNNK